MTITPTEAKLPTLHGGNAGSGGTVEWWNTVGVIGDTPEGSLPSVSYNGPIGSTFNGLTNWLHARGYHFVIPEGSTVSKVRAVVRARKTAGEVTITKAILRVVRPETPYLTFPTDTARELNLALTAEWEFYPIEWPGSAVHPRRLSAINELVEHDQFGAAIACTGVDGKVEVDVIKMVLDLDDGQGEEPTLLEALLAVRDELMEVRTLLSQTSPVIERADTAIGKADALITSLSENPPPA